MIELSLERPNISTSKLLSVRYSLCPYVRLVNVACQPATDVISLLSPQCL